VVETFIQVATEGRSIEFERFNPHFNKFFEVRAFSPKLGQFAAVFLDVTERKQAQMKLVGALKAANAASKAKTSFLAMMSHEIRTPMNGIIGMSELLLESNLPPEEREFVEIIKSSADSLLTVINDVLDISKIEAGKVTIERTTFNIEKTIRSVLGVMHISVRSKDLRMDVEIEDGVPDLIEGDQLRIRQVLLNLIGNAVKFTEKGSITVRASVKQASDQKGRAADSCFYLFVDVIDTGIGIEHDKITELFTPFTQGDAFVTRRFSGTGLGLSISRRLIELMGGAILVQSEHGVGSTFTIRVPVTFADTDHSQVTATDETETSSLQS
jgi:signal transduction histidine kinase